VKLGELGLRPFLEVSVREVIVPQRKFLFELCCRALKIKLEVVVDGMAMCSVSDIKHKSRVCLERVSELSVLIVKLIT